MCRQERSAKVITTNNHRQEHITMTIVIIGIILALLGAAASLYQINRNPNVAAEALSSEYWTMR
jgi:hypothetical protein